jgi:nucleoside-diphosphate-sugar epimerase
MDERRAVVTGASGWVGRAFIAHFKSLYGPDWSRRVSLFGSTGYALEFEGASLEVKALGGICAKDVQDADVFHLAFLTPEKVNQVGEEVFRETNIEIDRVLVDAMTAGPPRSLFVASSGAAALATSANSYHQYGAAKLRQEATMFEWGDLNDIPVFCGRIYNLAGPHLIKPQTYAIGSFITQALENRRIVVEAKVPVYRAYLHIMDLCKLASRAADARLRLSRPVDLSGPLITEIQEVAEAVASVLGLDFNDIRRVDVDFSRPSAYLGDATQLLSLAMRLGVRIASFEDQVLATVEYFNRRAEN